MTIATISLAALVLSFFGMHSEANEPAGRSGADSVQYHAKVMARSSGTPLRIGSIVTATLNAGSVFQVDQRNGDWLWIDSGNIQGWVKSQSVVAIDDAVKEFTDAIDERPESSEGYLRRGLARQAKGDHAGARDDFSRTIELDPANHWAFHDRATANHATKAFDRALADSDEAIRLDPAEPAHRANRASAQFARKEYEKAIADYSEALNRLKGDEITFEDEGPSRQTRARRLKAKWTCARAECWAAMNACDKAAGDFSEAFKIDPKDPLTCNAYAWLLATTVDPRLRDGFKAFDLAARACELTAFRNPLCLDTLAAAYACAGDFAAAVKWQVAALALVESDARVSADCRERLNLFMKNKPVFDRPAS